MIRVPGLGTWMRLNPSRLSGPSPIGSAIIVDENRHVIAYSSGSYLNSIAGLEAPPLLEDITDGSLSALYAQRHLSDVSESETYGEITRIMDEDVTRIGLARGFSIQGSSASWCTTICGF